jgi:hypothetical protein
MLVDPRPYTYEYRKPRILNPTLYASNNVVNHATSMRAYTIDTLTNLMITFLRKFQYDINPTIEYRDTEFLRNPNNLGAIFLIWNKGELITMNCRSQYQRLIEIHRNTKQGTDFHLLAE